ncbi:MAG: hypothetical protein H0W28_05690 [Pyrinomonadaceae bacterium]|nr:hypothetical protein [Pyrinomonadaceae bacterium]
MSRALAIAPGKGPMAGGEYAYEVLNLADGRRTAQDIRNAVSATYGPVQLDVVVEYLGALGSIRVIEAVR